MNKKPKKNRPNKPNPNPPQESEVKLDEVLPVEDKVTDIVEVPELKESDNESPKKPRRNRGKKKNEVEKELVEVEPETPINPASRKKKNKPKVEPNLDEKQDNIVTPVEVSVQETKKEDPKPVNIQETPKSPEPDGKSKKKKKNKKRTDSERSDKEEISCTAAFQKILQPYEPRAEKSKLTDKAKEQKAETESKVDKKESKAPEKQSKESKKDTEKQIVENIVETKPVETKSVIPIPPPPPPQEFLTKIQPVPEKPDTNEEEHKGKKKKKDKKYPKELEEQDLITALILGEVKIEPNPLNPFKIDKKDVVILDKTEKSDTKLSESNTAIKTTEQVKVETKNQDELNKPIEQELNIKTVKEETKIDKQAQLVVPMKIVEKEKTPQKEIPKQENEPKEKKLTEKDVKIPEQPIETKEITQDKVILDTESKPKAQIAKAVDKKGKKKQNMEPLIDASKLENEPKIYEGKSEEKIESIPPETTLKTEIADVPISETPIQAETKSEENYKKSSDIKLESTTEAVKQDVIPETRPIEPQDDKKQTLDTDNKSEPSKKSKKSPKPQRKNKHDNKPVTPEPIEKPDTAKPVLDEDISITDIEKDVEIEMTPDLIEPPRSSSAQLFDVNNNTLQETANLSVPVLLPDTPFITSTEEPLDNKSMIVKDEKTDLKSRVLEVNKDMEELRLSIEKSLAEFTSLERDEASLQTRDDIIIVTCAEVKTDKPADFIADTSQLPDEKVSEILDDKSKDPKEETQPVAQHDPETPIPPQRKDNKSKNKSKKKPKQETPQQTTQQDTATKESTDKDSEKTETKDDQKEETKTKQNDSETPIDKFEDAMTSSSDDVNKTFEMIVQDCEDQDTEGTDDKPNENPLVSQPKNLLGHPDIPVRSNKTDYKKERNKTPNNKQATVKIKDSEDISKDNLLKYSESVSFTDDNEEYVYKYSFRKVFLSNLCHICKKDLKNERVPCNLCNLIFYCCETHKNEDSAQHSDLCFAVTTIAHLKGQKHIYSDAKGITGHNYRLLRMQAIVASEKCLKRRLEPWEQEALLYPRICAETKCREWRQEILADCSGCGQISYCTTSPDHLPKIHARWCNSYSLYRKLVSHQLSVGRLEPRLPTKVLGRVRLTDNINRLLADMYDERIDMNDIQYASLTQVATAPLTAAYSYQIYKTKMDAVNPVMKENKLKLFTIHVVGAELQFEADSLNKWEIFFLHLRPDVEILKVVLIGPDLNPSKLPLDLLGKIKPSFADYVPPAA